MQKEELRWVTGVKGCCCVSVVLLHLLACLFPAAHNASVKYLPTTGIYNYIQLTPINVIFNGSFAVYIFWILSAFLMARSYQNSLIVVMAVFSIVLKMTSDKIIEKKIRSFVDRICSI